MIFTICIGLLVLLFINLSYSRYRFNKRLKGFVSPPALPLFGHISLFRSQLMLLVNLLDTVKKYGRFVKLELFHGLPLLVVTDKDFISHVLVQKPLLTKDLFYKLGEKLVGDGIITRSGNRWKKTRKMVNPAFNVQFLEKYMESLREPCENLIKTLKSQAENVGFDVMSPVSLCSLDVICEAVMGIKLNAQEDNNFQYVDDTNSITEIIMSHLFSPIKRLPFVYMFTRDYWKERKLVARIHSFTKSIVEMKKLIRTKSNSENAVNESSLLDVLLDAKYDGRPITDQEVIFETQNLIFAGYETAAITIASCLYCLSKHLDVQNRVLEELQMIFGSDRRYPTWRDLSQMRYLEMVIKETLRLYTAGPFISRLVDEDISFGEVFVPKGVSLFIFLYGVHRNPIYYPDPEKFDPSRFELDNSSLAFFPFSAGPRNCIGQRFAMLELKYILCQIIRNFVILPEFGYAPQVTICVGLKFVNGVWIKLQSR